MQTRSSSVHVGTRRQLFGYVVPGWRAARVPLQESSELAIHHHGGESAFDIYAVWRQRALLIASVMGTLTMAFIGLSFAFGVQLKRRMRAESELALLARTDGPTA